MIRSEISTVFHATPFGDRTFTLCMKLLREQQSPNITSLILYVHVPPARRKECEVQCKLEGLI